MTKAILLILFALSFEVLSTPFLLGKEENKTGTIQLNKSLLNKNNAITFHVISPEKVKICLTMIVKNESKIIERCLNSVKDIVDCISICDTGSTDNTIENIEQFMKQNKIPGKVHRHTWQNFGHNRTLSAQAAQKTLEELEFPLSTTYLLLLDADMILEVSPLFKKQPFVADSYSILQKNDELTYYNTRLVRASLPWECVGVTHEYWSCKQPTQESKLSTLTIDDREDGGCKADKYQRDIKLLLQGLKDDPNNARYMFYLAQTYKCSKNLNEAIRWYKARIAQGGWKEEVWYSKLMIGEIYEEMNFWDQALHWYLEAYQANPERAEPLQKIATYYRVRGQTDLAYLFAKQGSRIPFPKDQILFISHSVYDYQFDEEISIAAYYIPAVKEEGFAAADRLALKRGVPPHIKDQTYKNLRFYAQNIKNEEIKPIEFELPLIKEGSQEHYYAMNPTIQKTDDGYDVICRAINFDQAGEVNDKSSEDQDEKSRAKHFLLHYDQNFKLLSQREIFESSPEQRNQGIPGVGHPHSTQSEKNWLPFVKDNEIYAIYDYDPFIMYKINKETGNCETAIHYVPSYDFSRFRGSAPPIEFDGGYLLLIHEMVNDDAQRYDLHRFLYLDKNFSVAKLSRPFTFRHSGIESSCGMTIDHTGTKCIIPIGDENQRAHFVDVDLETIRSSLRS